MYIRSWAIKRSTFITALRVPGALNIEADKGSRKSELRTDCKLNEIIRNQMKVMRCYI